VTVRPLAAAVRPAGVVRRRSLWQNPGPQNGGWTEWGYDIGNLNDPNTRATFYGITPTHYAFHFWSVKSKTDPGKPIESDSCRKIAPSF
jgi:hypothetical protein